VNGKECCQWLLATRTLAAGNKEAIPVQKPVWWLDWMSLEGES